MSRSRCQELLESQSIGRVAWQAADGPQILPVTYAYHGGTIIFRTSPYGVLSELVRPTDVALEIDELDQQSRQVWSVVVQGRAQGIADALPAGAHVGRSASFPTGQLIASQLVAPQLSGAEGTLVPIFWDPTPLPQSC